MSNGPDHPTLYPELQYYLYKTVVSSFVRMMLGIVSRLILLALFAIAIVLITRAQKVDGFEQNLLLNMGTTLLGVLIAFVIFDILWITWIKYRTRVEFHFPIDNLEDFEKKLSSEEMQLFNLLSEAAQVTPYLFPLGIGGLYHSIRLFWKARRLGSNKLNDGVVRSIEKKYLDFMKDRHLHQQVAVNIETEIVMLKQELSEVKRLLTAIYHQKNEEPNN